MNEDNIYTLHVAGLKRKLPKIKIDEKLTIASFVMLGDTELIERTAAAIYEHPMFPKYNIDVLVCPEAKAIPLAHAIAKLLQVNYIVARKSVKSYMSNPVTEVVTSITTKGEQLLVLDGTDIENIKGRNICIIDDVVSTGGSIRSLEKLLERVGCKVVCKATVLLEEAGYEGGDLVYLERLPIFITQ
ncbi:MAG: phosphoribosyltransferase family protein [Spirochaetia bacterium]|jgi:adenine phosphoribosyltransferase|nr:phosphoribosyltransferase family protein [Spirochaetia bacterium]